ncbi:DUF397 domain-containing protein [uncultured Streptomyces sp.]|uniref:DUF397 domain-containing protein n=1 Tax=uncultured Streptomyces sp. TaxID=174707 RepID=UPI002633E1F3|nr:DUF397 domain-containing protein [uncultured Streptomyces sp.]
MHSTKPAIADSSAWSGWRKSTYSGGANGECLEVARGHATVPVRDSKVPAGPAVVFSAEGWSSFVTAVKDGRLSA